MAFLKQYFLQHIHVPARIEKLSGEKIYLKAVIVLDAFVEKWGLVSISLAHSSSQSLTQ
jgi:hypothetical protein